MTSSTALQSTATVAAPGHPGGAAVKEDQEEVKTTIRIPRSLLRAAKVWAAEHDRSFNDAVAEALTRLTKGGK